MDKATGRESTSAYLAEILQRHIVAQTGARNRGVRQASLFIGKARMPAALVEVGFLTHPLEAKQLQSLPYQNKIADAILNAILEFFQNTY